MMKWRAEEYLEEDGTHLKFGCVRSDNTLEVPNRLTLKWIPNYYWRLNEQQSTFIMYVLTAFFCTTAILFID